MINKKITECEIGPYPKDLFDTKMPEVKVTYEDGKEEVLFDFYPDEMSFTEEEFIGLTRKEAKRLKFKKDKQFLQT